MHNTRVAVVAALLLCAPTLWVARQVADPDSIGPKVGASVPTFALTDQGGNVRTLDSLMGPQGLMLVFSRSADWCPYCRTQMVELQRQLGSLKQQGLGLAVITYDPVATLQRFATEHGIAYPLLSDTGSATIQAYGLLNETAKPGTPAYGIPHPGTFVLDRDGVVVERYFESAYQERNTVSSILAKRGAIAGSGPAVTATTAHLSVTATASDAVVAPGSRLTLAFEVTPRPGMHLYAPGRHTYQVVRVELDPQPWLEPHSVSYPPSEIYHFVPLDERVEVYKRPFRLLQDVTIRATREVQQQLAGRTSLTITGRLEYQACDDRVCYNPTSVPVEWTLDLTALVRPGR